MSKKNKPISEIIVGLFITGAAAYFSVKGITAQPSYIDVLFFTVPALIIGLIITLSEDATKAGQTIYKFFVRL